MWSQFIKEEKDKMYFTDTLTSFINLIVEGDTFEANYAENRK